MKLFVVTESAVKSPDKLFAATSANVPNIAQHWALQAHNTAYFAGQCMTQKTTFTVLLHRFRKFCYHPAALGAILMQLRTLLNEGRVDEVDKSRQNHFVRYMLPTKQADSGLSVLNLH